MSTSYTSCKNCGCEPDIRAHGGRGHCTRCYPLVRRIAEVKAWRRESPETLKGIPKNGETNRAGEGFGLITDGFSDEKFEIFRKEHLRQFKKRLGYLRIRQEMRKGIRPVEPLDLEHKFGKLLHFVKSKAQYPHNASYLAAHFDQEHRRVVYGLLDDIEDHIRWHGVSWSDVYERMRESKDKPNRE